MATRPTRKEVASGLEGWDADMDDNFEAIMDTPFPPASYSNYGALPNAAAYEGCIAYVEDIDTLFVSHDSHWQPLAPETHYETTEKDSHLRWIDDSTIYVKTVSLGSLPNSSSDSTAHGISDLDEVIKFEGAANGASNRYDLTSSPDIEVYINNTNVVVTTTANFSTYTGYITIYYLKNS